MTVIQFRKRPSPQDAADPARSNAGNPEAVRPPQGVRAIGIDLGTTNSVVSVYTPGCQEPETLLYDDVPLVPSVLYFDPQLGHEVVGTRAWLDTAESPETLIRGTKRSMGSVAPNYFSGEKNYTPEDTAALVLEHLAGHPTLVEEREKHGGIWAVITVPAHFDDAARQATIRAAGRANINVLRIVNEPTAAALAYSMLPDVRNTDKETLSVFDFGGGTFDVSVVDREGLVFGVLSSEGDIYLGGDDIDLALTHHLLQFVKPFSAGHKAKPNSALFRKLLRHAEAAKIAFEGQGVVHIADADLDGAGSQIDIDLNRESLEEIAAPFVQRTLELTERALHAARRRPQAVSRVLLVGGSTRLWLVRKMLGDYFPGCNIDARLEPDYAVSWGAAVQAAIILGIEPETILVDVCSHSLGIGVAEDSASVNENYRRVARKYGILHPLPEEQILRVLGERAEDFHRDLQSTLRVAPIIHRNSPLPARRSEFFSTLYENQSAVHVVVVQGESNTVGENRLIGSFLFDLQQPCPKGSRCEIQLTYDSNGMVHVLARQMETENAAEAQFDSRTGKVIGWHRLDHDESSAPLLMGATDNGEESFAQPKILNTLIVRTRRALLGLSSLSPEAESLMALLDTYENLLSNAQAGANNDTEIEFVEDQLTRLLEEVSRG